MAVTTKKSLLFLMGGAAAAAIVAFFAGALDPLLGRQPAATVAVPAAGTGSNEVAAAPPPEPPSATQPPASSETVAPPAEAPASAGEQTAPAAADSGAKRTVVPPSFDVVRVEPDGSIVIAGKAVPSAKVDLLVGSKLLGSAAAGPEGDFAVVLDDPLDPGDYQIVLRATAPDDVVAMSVETAVVSVPTSADGQVLALVEEPGKPSQMITLPKPQAPATDAKPPAAEPPAATTDAPKPAEPAQTEPTQTEPTSAEEAQAALSTEQLPAEPQPVPPPSGPSVRVEAVEIDGGKIFVAGVADPGRNVRAYANEILLGNAKSSPDGRFLVEADRDLPVGDYIIRVDALEADGNKVAARAAVPFEREPGESIAAVAAPEQQQAPSALAPEPVAPPSGETGSPDAAASDTVAPAEPTTPPAIAEAQDSQPHTQGGTPAQATPGTEAPDAGMAEAPPAGTGSAEAPAVAATAAAPSDSQPQAQQTSPAPATSTDAQPGASEAASAGEVPEAETGIAAAPAEEGENLPSPPSADGVTEVLAPKLKSVGSAVIIRRGDTLWRISRRVYGRGVRYSTIYLANQNQIADPDRIWPGQVFAVPDKSNDGKVDADYSKLGDRLTTMPEGEQPAQPQAQQ